MRKQIVCLAAIAAAVFTLVTPAGARLFDVYTEFPFDPRQDNWRIEGPADELGNLPAFPPPQQIASWQEAWQGHIPCPVDFQGTAVQVRMQNLTGRSFFEGQVFYVADTPETFISNVDEWVGEVGFAPGQAFMIDRPAFLGGTQGQANTPLIWESFAIDGVWQPNEIWEFVIQDYNNIYGLSPAAFGSIGIGGASLNPPDFPNLSSGSIVVIPEPSCAMLIALGGLAAFWARRPSR